MFYILRCSWIFCQTKQNRTKLYVPINCLCTKKKKWLCTIFFHYSALLNALLKVVCSLQFNKFVPLLTSSSMGIHWSSICIQTTFVYFLCIYLQLVQSLPFPGFFILNSLPPTSTLIFSIQLHSFYLRVVLSRIIFSKIYLRILLV